MHHSRFCTGRWRLVVAGLLLLAGAGCQMLRAPWSSSAGLPAQWEPAVESSSSGK